MIYLLDLNFTLVANNPPRGTAAPPMAKRMETESYRKWLVEMLRPHKVILITARPAAWKEPTLARIAALTGWQPMDAFFDDGVTWTPPAIKRHILIDLIFPKYGRGDYYAIESNPKTRAVYARLGIPSVWVTKTGRALKNDQRQFRELPAAAPQGGLDLG